ncbi:MAG: adenylate/guanylate cyclase domain-containing protein [Flavobacteriales bacterium]
MTRTCIAFLVLFHLTGTLRPLHAQAPTDSLWTVYRSPKAAPKARLHALRDLFDNNAISQTPDSFAKYVGAMTILAEQVGDRTLIASALMNRGVQYNLLGDPDRADSCYIRADSINGPKGDRLLRAQIRANQGLTLESRGLMAAAMDQFEEALVVAKEFGNKSLVTMLQNNMAGQYAQSGNIAKAVELFTSTLRIAEQQGDSGLIGSLLSNIGACHNLMGDVDLAKPYFKRAAAVFERIQHPNLPRPYLNLANAYTYNTTDLDSALYYCDRSIAAAEQLRDDAILMAAYDMKSNMLRSAGRPDSAMACLQKALEVAQGVQNRTFEMMLKGSLSHMLFEQGRTAQAIDLAEEMLEGGKELGNVEMQTKAADRLVEYYRHAGRYDKALAIFQLQVSLRDSMEREENQRETIRQEYKYDYEKQALADSLSFAAETAIQQEEVQKQKLMRNGFMGGFALVAIFAGVFFFQRNRIGKEKARSEELLLNILPEEVAEELKEKGSAHAQRIDLATVLFTDFKGFTAYSENLSPEQLVHDLNECFTAFDHIIARHGMEKIKTIGDAYMAAGGLPVANSTHATDTVKAALEIRDFIAEGKARKTAAGLPYFEIRVGIHTGPVVAGIVGVKKFSYDIWGDTVNTASRMESSGEAGQVNISEATYELVKNEPDLSFTPRGKVQAKGKGEMEMYFVERTDRSRQ